MITKNPMRQTRPLRPSRREFIRTATTMSLAAAAGPSALFGALDVTAKAAQPEPKTLIGSNIYGWGQYYQREKKDVMEHLDEVLSALRDAGYDYLEATMDSAQPENNAQLADRMKAKGLQPVSIYTGGRLHEAGKASEVVEKLLVACRVCRQAGFRVISCNADPIGREKTDDELKVQAAAFTEFGKGLKEMGMKLGVHHHLPEMANHAREFHYIFRHTDPALVGFCYDVHWVYRGGIAPAEALAEYGNRVVSWHLRQSRNGIWWEDLDTGDIDYQAVAQYAREHSLARRFTVELALENGTRITRSVVENHRRSIVFVRHVFGDQKPA
ncbi:MAG: sugar phosphate isomerase/epimerase [Candidatus Omnitrophica bacterium]|nr:sugar phosphate isomerase/epimerase [Candidatus Omnitrophota bacterium]